MVNRQVAKLVKVQGVVLLVLSNKLLPALDK